MNKKVQFANAAAVGIEAHRWLWPGFIPSGALTILAGVPGSGKSTITMDIAAAVSAGTALPTGEIAQRGRVLVCNEEDHQSRTMTPRLLAAEANMDNIYFPEKLDTRSFYNQDVPFLERVIRSQAGGDSPIRLLIIDPITSVAAGSSGLVVRSAMENLKRIAEEYDVAVLGVTHFSKGSSRKAPIERVIGSLAYAAVARMVLAAIESESTGEKLLIKVKSNTASTVGILSYGIQQVEVSQGDVTVSTTALEWGELKEEEYIHSTSDKEASALDAARNFLLNTLQNGPRRQREIEDDLQMESFSVKTLRRAGQALGIKPYKSGMHWLWALPSQP